MILFSSGITRQMLSPTRHEESRPLTNKWASIFLDHVRINKDKDNRIHHYQTQG